MVDKSELLDELRLAVGSVPDYAKSLTDFYHGIVFKLVSEKVTQFSVSLYEVKETEFAQVTFAGLPPSEGDVPFGEGLQSIAAVRGEIVFEMDDDNQFIIAPFYKGHHLIGQLFFEIPHTTYTVSTDDLIFIKEVTRFIESKYDEFT
ncbi:hypothetical protein [Bacillus sp. FJAT-45037]|uniref:hypothetical protein n=1 Tax=Bacillus sp. FJAT-45037 TaxID=2011007 RepID=UPI000C2495E6|nr:hypothetical protein [Bacillus sp. FJAT-45037]